MMPEKTKVKLRVKDVQDFVKSKYILFASATDRRFFVTLHASPNLRRYAVEVHGVMKDFVKVGDAVRYFNGENE